MKRTALLSLVIIFLLSSACKKSSDDLAVGVTASKGATAWKTTDVYTGFKPLATKDTLVMVARNNEDNIVIEIKQKGAGTYSPSEFKAYYYATIGLDAVVARYQLASNPANSIVITDYNESTHVVQASFNLAFTSTYILNNPTPQQITFRGKINAPLSDVYLDAFTGF